MGKKSLFILLVIMCIGLFVPKNTFAMNQYKNINFVIDYKFSVNEDENNAGNLKFKLYDNEGLSFLSEYDETNKYYYFYCKNCLEAYYLIEHNEYPIIKEIDDVNFTESDDFTEFEDYARRNKMILGKKFIYNYINYIYGCQSSENYFCGDKFESSYKIVPLILEEVNNRVPKMIVIAIIHVSRYYEWDDRLNEILINMTLLNTTNENNVCTYRCINSTTENIQFMRNAIYKYDEELWMKLNNEIIASSEISSDDGFVLIDNNGTNNLKNPSILHFLNKEDNEESKNEKDNVENKGKAEIIIAKHRNGSVGNVKLLFQGNITKFKNPIKTDVF